MYSPKVSVIIPNYNHARFLDRRISSVLDQTYQDFELLILDDGSKDDSLSVIAKYADDPRMTVVKNETNGGSVFKQWNKGVRWAKGEYVWIAESDDDAEPLLLETLVRRLDADPAAVLAYCRPQLIDTGGRPLDEGWFFGEGLSRERWEKDFVNSGYDEATRFLIHRNTIPNASGVVFRRQAYLEAGLAPEGFVTSGDWMTWANMCFRGNICYSSAPLNRWRRHEKSVCAATAEIRKLPFVLEAAKVRIAICTATAQAEVRQKALDAVLQEVYEGALHMRGGTPVGLVLKLARISAGFGRTTPLRVALVYLRARIDHALMAAQILAGQWRRRIVRGLGA